MKKRFGTFFSEKKQDQGCFSAKKWGQDFYSPIRQQGQDFSLLKNTGGNDFFGRKIRCQDSFLPENNGVMTVFRGVKTNLPDLLANKF